MPKAEAKRRFNEEWKVEFSWATAGKDYRTHQMTKCKICPDVEIRSHKSSLRDHEKSSKHKTRDPNKTQSILKFTEQPAKIRQKKAEIQLAAAVACHASMSAVHHIGEIITNNGHGSTWESSRTHRTKCSAIVVNVIGKDILNELRGNLKERRFSILVDESTDISVTKLLVITIRYFNGKIGNIVDEYLGIVEVLYTTGTCLLEATKELFEMAKIDLSMCIGYGSDGANNVSGSNNSLWTRIKAESPSAILVKCVCHSLDLVVKHAFEVMPSNLGYLITEVPAFFSKSNIRRNDYKQLYAVMNPDDVGYLCPFKRFSKTRWLV